MRKLLFPIIFLESLVIPLCLFAANTESWRGNGSNNNWTTPQNWNPVFTPVNGDLIVFNGGFQNPVNVNMNFATFTPSSITFTNNVTCQLLGSGVLQVGTLNSCPSLTCSASFAEWQSGTSLAINGALELTGGLSGTLQFANLTGSGDLKVDTNVNCNLTEPNTLWTASTVTIAGTINVNASDALPTGCNVVMQNQTNAQLNLGSSVQATIQNLTGGEGGSLTLNNSSILSLQNASGTYSGQIVQAGGELQIQGSSVYTLTGSNGGFSQSISVDIQSGTLKAGTSNSLPGGYYSLSAPAMLDLNGFSTTVATINGSGTINLSSNSSGGVLAPTTGTSVFSGVIQDGGLSPGIVRLDGGITTLSGMNTYTGGTIIGFAELQIYTLSNLGSPTNSNYLISFEGVSTLKALGNLTLNPSSGLGLFIKAANHIALFDVSAFPMTISCPISGAGSLQVEGSKTLTLAGSATYNAGTSINGGTLALADGGSLPTVGTVNVMSGAVLDISPLTSPVTSTIGPLSGSGSVSLGSNTLEVNSGSIATTFSGSLTDGGSGGGLIKSGNAAFTLTGVNTYLGLTQIHEGTLVVGVGGVGSLTNSDVTVASGATLKGTGTISQTVTIQSGGTISGGNSIGTIHIGALTLDPGANLTLEIDSTGASTIYDVTNTATLAGNVAVTVDRGNYQAGTTYTFIQTGASGRIGTFDTVTSNTFGTTTLTGRLDYGSDFVQLVLFAPIYAIIPVDGLTGNAKNVAQYLNSLSAYPEVQPVLLAIGELPLEQAEKALDSISPARNAISSWTAQNALFGVNQVAVNRMLQQRYMRWIETNEPAIAGAFDELLEFEDRLLASQVLPTKQKKEPYGKAQTDAKGDSYYAVWAEGFGLFARQNAIHENPAYHSSTGCGLVGADFYNFKNGQMGTALGYAQSSIQESGTGHGSIQYYLAGLYGTAYIDDGYVELSLWSSFDQFHNTRDIAYPGFSIAATSDHNAWQLVPHIGGGYDFNFSWGALEPFATFDAAALFQQGYSEHGAGVLNIRVKSSTSWLLRSETGLNAYQVIHWASSYLIFREKLSYVNLAPYGIGKLADSALVGFPPGFTVRSFSEVQNMIAPGFELFFKCHNGFFFSLAYEGEFTIGPGNYMSNEAIGKIGCFF